MPGHESTHCFGSRSAPFENQPVCALLLHKTHTSNTPNVGMGLRGQVLKFLLGEPVSSLSLARLTAG